MKDTAIIGGGALGTIGLDLASISHIATITCACVTIAYTLWCWYRNKQK